MTDRLISLQSAVDELARVAREKFNLSDDFNHYLAGLMDGEKAIRELPEAVIRCKDCKCGEQDEDGNWYCRSIGATVGASDGTGYCADAERRGQDERI